MGPYRAPAIDEAPDRPNLRHHTRYVTSVQHAPPLVSVDD
jgi:hypothetical protein